MTGDVVRPERSGESDSQSGSRRVIIIRSDRDDHDAICQKGQPRAKSKTALAEKASINSNLPAVSCSPVPTGSA